MIRTLSNLPATIAIAAFCLVVPVTNAAEPDAQEILAATGVQGGLIVHVGCGDGRLTAELRAGDGYLVQGLDANAENVQAARDHVQSTGLYGPISIDGYDGTTLPYIDNLVNLIVAEEPGALADEEIMRALCPGGVAYLKRDGQWAKTVKPRPAEIDDWSHYLHDAGGNAVSHDSIVGPPKRMQWLGSPRWARHHDNMSSISALVSAGGRLFYVMDEGSRASILVAPKWTVIARDAFNGTILWKRQIDRWHTHLWPLKSGPAQLPRRLVADSQRVYVTLNLDGPLVALDAATGETVRTYENTAATEEVICHDGVLFAMVNDAKEKPDYDGRRRFRQGYNVTLWDEQQRNIVALRADTGEKLWSVRRCVLPVTLAANAGHVVFHDGQSVVCLDRHTGKELWHSEPVARSEKILSFYAPTLVLYENVVLFSGGETAGMQTGLWYEKGEDTLTALSIDSGKVLWTAYHPPSGYRSPEDLLVAGGLVWTGETTSGRVEGLFTGRDPHTGEVKSEFTPDVEIYWFHHRCYRGKATDKYLLMARAGTEFVDVANEHWIPHHWVRGACSYGIMPANGLLYAPPHPCACYLEAKLNGFNALAPGRRAESGKRKAEPRLQRGPAYNDPLLPLSAFNSPLSDSWPTYRHNAARSGRASTSVPASLGTAWRTKLGGKLSSPVIAENKLLVASIDTHTVHALDAGSGEQLWHYTAGARIDSPPTIYRGRVLFGSADGWVYCLRTKDGQLAWRFRAAPSNQRLTAFEQVESVWPVPGSVLVQDGTAYCVAGRSMFLDGGLRLLRLDPATGRLISETVLNETEEATGKDMHEYVSWLNMPPALPDVLSSDGRLVYMRSQPFELDGTRLPLEAMPYTNDANFGYGAKPPKQRAEHAHLFSPTGLLDDSWWHRSYWMFGSQYVSGWCGFFLAGKSAPAGRILVFDEEKVYGFGRKPRYFSWTSPIEHHLFAADRISPEWPESDQDGPQETLVRVTNSPSLNPAGKPLTVEAWVNAQRPNGVVLARGGGIHGYTLYIEGGRPHFGIRVTQELKVVSAKAKLAKRWVHLAGVLTAEKKLQLYVDGQLAASADAPGLIAADPADLMEIGADHGSVGNYASPFAFAGLVDEVRIYHRALSAAEIQQRAAGSAADEENLALAYDFNDGKATDRSGHENHGEVAGAAAVKGKAGRALQFTGRAGLPADFMVNHHWTADVPLFARAMVLADGTLFMAGPPDQADEEQMFRQINDPAVQSQLADQAAALAGRRGAVLWAVSADDGEKLAELKLDFPPVFDGMAAAGKCLYVVTIDGSIVCLAGR